MLFDIILSILLTITMFYVLLRPLIGSKTHAKRQCDHNPSDLEIMRTKLSELEKQILLIDDTTTKFLKRSIKREADEKRNGDSKPFIETEAEKLARLREKASMILSGRFRR